MRKGDDLLDCAGIFRNIDRVCLADQLRRVREIIVATECPLAEADSPADTGTDCGPDRSAKLETDRCTAACQLQRADASAALPAVQAKREATCQERATRETVDARDGAALRAEVNAFLAIDTR